MSENTIRPCPKCGAELGPDAPESLCPKCLMDNAAWSQTLASPDEAQTIPYLGSYTPSSTVPELLPQDTDFGRYRILHLLGRGGMGSVYEAEDLESGRRVALKVLSHKLDSEDARKRFIREGRLAASINHPNSVYVFGTEEIEGTPTISMEIVPGGTLQEKVVREGPMQAPKAVDAILQIVAGLEAAQAIGILHRDVKPSNCFVDELGAAKIGDFGLSITTDTRGDSHLTVRGSLLGTPAFSSPEQLRGDEINARSDMYSVGATLFYLLTGHAPFEEGNMVKLLSRVLEETPVDPRTHQKSIPSGLARIVLRCLAKTPTDRFKSYAELERALQPYSTVAPSPATLALRFAAYFVDTVVIGVASLFLQALAWGSFGEVFNQANFGTAKYYLIALALNVLTALYFGVLEGTRGAAIGKMLLRLRVVRRDGGVAGVPRAFLRASFLLLLLSGPYWLMTGLHPDMMTNQASPWTSMAVGGMSVIMLGVVFCMARRRNGYAGLHGLATGTRVVRAPAPEKRPRLSLGETAPGDPLEGAERIGPYHVIEVMGPSDVGRWVLAYDTRLLRRIWVHAVAPGTPSISIVQRGLNRPGRLRWITGRRSEGENWDAFEAPTGRPLTELLDAERSWNSLRFWLLDLVNEFAASEGEGTTPPVLAFDRVWITEDGRAKLLDFPAPGASPVPEQYDSPAALVAAIGNATIEKLTPPAPLHARAMLTGTPKLETLFSQLHQSVRRPASISRLRRIGITLAVSAFPLLGVAMGVLIITMTQGLQRSQPELMELSSVTHLIQFTESDQEREDLRRFVAHRYSALVTNPDTWKHPGAALVVDPHRQRIAREAVAQYESLTPDEISAAEAAGQAALKIKFGQIPELPPIAPLVLVMTCWITYSAIPSLLMALLFRRGLVMMSFGATVATKEGKPAGRLRVLWRCLLAWSPFTLGAVLAFPLFSLLGPIPTTVIVIGTILVLTIYSNTRRDRTLHDRLAGTWLIPK
jgi:uncharacterized RDD family membrane protein YckC